jgi:hypothetical protein
MSDFVEIVIFGGLVFIVLGVMVGPWLKSKTTWGKK